MVELVTRNYWWPGVMRDVKKYVLGLVHGTGLQTRAGTRVRVRWVWVRVRQSVPVQNPYPCDGFGGYPLF